MQHGQPAQKKQADHPGHDFARPFDDAGFDGVHRLVGKAVVQRFEDQYLEDDGAAKSHRAQQMNGDEQGIPGGHVQKLPRQAIWKLRPGASIS